MSNPEVKEIQYSYDELAQLLGVESVVGIGQSSEQRQEGRVTFAVLPKESSKRKRKSNEPDTTDAEQAVTADPA
jgi:hypothetical protein